MSLKVYPILCNINFMDNYAYVIVDEKSQQCAIIDAPEAYPIIKFCDENNLKPSYILITHHHEDHTNAIGELKKYYNLQVVGGALESDKIPLIDIKMNNADLFTLGNTKAQIITVQGHTNGHILWYFAQDKKLFTGDMLFNLSIGGLFEGTPQQMWHSLQIIKSLPGEVQFYPGHEYTNISCLLANNTIPQVAEYWQFLKKCKENNVAPVGVTLGLEKQCNPYLRIQRQQDFINMMR